MLILLCTHIYWKINTCVKKINFAERESEHKRKDSDVQDDFDVDPISMAMELLSMNFYGKETEKLEELGTMGGSEGMEHIQEHPKEEHEDKYNRRESQKKIESEGFESHEGTSKEVQEEEAKETQQHEIEPKKDSSLLVYNTSYKSSVEIDKAILHDFVKSINKSNALLPIYSSYYIEEILGAGISGEESISKLHEEYPINQSKKINFKNLKFAFGTELESLRGVDEEHLNNALFFDDFFVCNLNDFLNETIVGKFSLAEVNSYYNEGSIKLIQCNADILKYLSSKFAQFNIENFLSKNMGIYLGRNDDSICRFWNSKIPLIQEHTMKDLTFLGNLKINKKSRNVTYGEQQELRQVIYNGSRNSSYMIKKLSVYEKRIEQIEYDLGLLLQIFPINMKYLRREVAIITCIHYTLSYSVELVKPLQSNVMNKDIIKNRDFYYVSSCLNELINNLEILEFNSELYNIFIEIYPSFDKHYPRLNSFQDITSVFSFLVVKLHFTVVIFNTVKLFSKLDMCTVDIAYYRENILAVYNKIITDAQTSLRDAQDLIKELT
ncbi:KELT protein [Plasmodium ovale wallikeri]|nr:KELT protein [Plasmodium ovale wallikeri]SBT44335.1 KELT protein [Plasmodium ovale wallikeri]